MQRSQEIAEILANRMAAGEIKAGARLPAERSLAASLGASRGCVREALRSLAERGLVESRPGSGSYARSPAVQALALDLTEAWTARRLRLAHVFAFCRVLETGAAELAARGATDRDLEQLKVVVCDQQRRLLDGSDDADLDAAFHQGLARATGNPVFVQALAALAPLLAESRARDLQTPQRRRASAEHHLRILDALARRDPELARRAMDAHLRETEREALEAAADRP